MEAVTPLTTDDHEIELREAVRTAYEAELEGAPMQNGKQRDTGVSKNTDFEFPFGGDGHPEAYVYIKRYPPGDGIEVMLWADYAWFDGDGGDYEVVPSDGDAPLGEFADDVLSLVAGELGTDSTPAFEFHQNARPSVVFSAVFTL